MHRFAVPSEGIRSGQIRLRGAELRRLRDVLRLRPGAEIEVFDRAGSVRIAEVVAVGTSAADLRVLRTVERRTESPLSVTLAAALSKGAKLDWVVEKTTELGVARIIPFASERTVPERESTAHRLGRLRRLADSAAAQSGRAASPIVDEVTSLPEVLRLCPLHDRAVFFWEEAGSPLRAWDDEPAPRRVLLITGAEGGFSRREAAAARESGCVVAGLGPRILRAETAAVAVVALAQFLWGDLAC